LFCLNEGSPALWPNGPHYYWQPMGGLHPAARGQLRAAAWILSCAPVYIHPPKPTTTPPPPQPTPSPPLPPPPVCTKPKPALKQALNYRYPLLPYVCIYLFHGRLPRCLTWNRAVALFPGRVAFSSRVDSRTHSQVLP